MNRSLKTLFGAALVAAGIALKWRTPDTSDWLVIVLVGLGCHFVSNSMLADAVGQALRLLPWKKEA